VPPDKGPSVRFRRIGRTLRELREDAGLTLSAAGRRLERSTASLSMIENGLQQIRPRDLAYILDFYGVPSGPVRASLLHLAQQGRQKDWMRSYEGRISAAGLDYASCEADSAVIRGFELYLVPGLLQTEAYARAVMDAGLPSETRDNAELVAFRMARQKILARPDPPRLVVVIGEAALRQSVGGRDVMRAQLERLIEAAALDHVALRVLPFSAGARPGLDGRFNIFDLRAPGRLTVVVVEDLTRMSFRERDEEAIVFAAVFDRLRAAALDEARSLALMKRIRSGT
jgi:transcriptional regulator with XRE-family HTH domain